jgi:hypothetical protein
MVESSIYKYHESIQCQFFCKYLAWGERFIFTILKKSALDRRKIQDVISPYVPYILRVLLREIAEEDKENKE